MNPRCNEPEMQQPDMMNMNMQQGACCPMPGNMCPPIYECPQERVCERYIMHEVPHIMPCNTRIINHHVYRHTFTPCYTQCEQETVENVYDQKCCF